MMSEGLRVTSGEIQDEPFIGVLIKKTKSELVFGIGFEKITVVRDCEKKFPELSAVLKVGTLYCLEFNDDGDYPRLLKIHHLTKGLTWKA